MNEKDLEILAITWATTLFSDFMDKENRGSNWTPDTMPKLVSNFVERQALLNGIPSSEYPTLVGLALTFYKRYFDAIVRASA